ncbi:hypothetical protein NA56DRAFT_650194 [Hyaloscypha hepaticicola]|uniref:Transmembrane protein n=1 Tax=Hyaloscypha hepaticicola TaxID=2082293 RepID=A0A2J6PN75_9HELO|nr:hypothetical protein NA56DRAFT_650194 [Hyaloscypha hepaticicola]
MLFGKLFTGLAFAALSIAPVACAPTCEKNTAVLQVTATVIGDNARTCYNGVQSHCNNINNYIHQNNGQVSVSLAAQISVELQACVDLLATLYGQVSVATLTKADIQDAAPVFASTVTLLTSVLASISTACVPGAIAVLVNVVASLLVQVNLLSGCFVTGVEGVLGLVLGGAGGVLAGLKLNINLCVSLFASVAAVFH